MQRFVRWLGSASPGASLVDAHGVLAAVVPAAPHRSVFNSAVYPDAAALERALPELAAAYDAAGVRAWTVWTPPGDRRAAGLLAGAGHVLDAEPAAMVAQLAGFEPPPLGDLDWTREVAIADVADINDAAYGHGDGSFRAALQDLADLHGYLALDDGRPACGLAIADHGGSAGVYFVATRPESQGRRLASRLLGQALVDARDRGCVTATLQATRTGAPVYERLGFRTEGRIQMWERRRS